MLLATVQLIFYLTFLYGLQQSCINEVEFFISEESTDPAVRFCMSYIFFELFIAQAIPTKSFFLIINLFSLSDNYRAQT